MEITEAPIQTDHPPHPIKNIGNGFSVSRTVLKGTLFLSVFSICFHPPNDLNVIQKRESTILQIRSVLESRQTDLASVTKEDLAEAIYEECIRYNHDPKFILAVIDMESNFYNWAVSKKGAKGLMQIMPDVAQSLAQQLGIEWMGDRTLFNPFLNVKMGLYYLSQLVKDFEDLGAALTAYNYGPTYVRNLLDSKQELPLQYYRQVLSIYRTL